MPGFLYFLPGAGPGITAAEIEAAGLAYAFDAPPSKRAALNGPSGVGGVVLAELPAEQVGYHSDRQTWRRVPGRQAWVGYYADQPLPGPGDLQRDPQRLVNGHPVRLAGHDWIVPIAVGVSGDEPAPAMYCNLPRLIDWDDDGRRKLGDVVPEYRALWQAASEWWEAKRLANLEDDPGRALVAIESDLAIAALAVNYRIGKAEAGILGLLSDQAEIAVLDATIDWPGWLAILDGKKNRTSASPPSTGGPGASTEATARPSRT